MKHRIASLVLALVVVSHGAEAFDAETRTEAEARLTELALEIAEADAEADQYDGGLLQALAETRAQTLALTAAILEARLTADSADANIEITFPVVEPDLERAARIEAEIAQQETIIAEAEAEVAGTGGLIQAVAQSRVYAEKLNLARLRGALFQAKYGATLPVEIDDAADASAASNTISEASPNSSDDIGMPSPPAWADADHPEIDYTHAIFKQLNDEDFEIHGWWGVLKSRADIDDSPSVLAIQVEDRVGSTGFKTSYPGLQIGCREGEVSFIYDVDSFLTTDFRRPGFEVTYRIDDAAAASSRWSALTGSEGAGLFGADGVRFLRSIYDADKLFLRLVENNGNSHDGVFKLAGVKTAIDETAAACGASMLDLSRSDYRAIQEMLNAAGHNVGKPDGVWGAGSKAGMKAFQKANDLKPTGAPDQETLRAMGLSF